MPDRHHEEKINLGKLYTNSEIPDFQEIVEQGRRAARDGKLGFECPYYAINELEKKKVQEWFKGFYEIKDEKK